MGSTLSQLQSVFLLLVQIAFPLIHTLVYCTLLFNITLCKTV